MKETDGPSTLVFQGRAPTSAAAALASRPGDAGGEETDDDETPRAYPEAGALSASGQKVPPCPVYIYVYIYIYIYIYIDIYIYIYVCLYMCMR